MTIDQHFPKIALRFTISGRWWRGTTGADAVAVQVNHDIADHALLRPGCGNLTVLMLVWAWGQVG